MAQQVESRLPGTVHFDQTPGSFQRRSPIIRSISIDVLPPNLLSCPLRKDIVPSSVKDTGAPPLCSVVSNVALTCFQRAFV